MTDSAAEPDTSKADDDILEQARTRYQLCMDADSDNREKALADLRFLSGDQWDEKDKTRRTTEGRPALTINKLPTFLHQVTNDQRMNKPGIKVHPVDDDADEETAEVEQGLIRHIEYSSNADVAYDRSVNSAAAIGVGYFQLTTKFCDPKSFDQDIIFKSIRNALSVKIDPLSTEPDGSDMQFCFIESRMARTEFEKQYPNANATSMSFMDGSGAYHAWLSKDVVMVCEYYRIERTDATLVMLADGTPCYKDEVPKDARLMDGKERQSYKQKVMWYKITGVDVLESTEIKCDWIPLFPVYGDEIDIEGKVVRSGLVRYARDPAMMYNYWMTAATEEVAMRNKTPYIGAEGQFEGYEDDWANANTQNFAYLQYKPVTLEGSLAPAPVRQPMADVPTGVLAMAMHANDNIKATTGLFDSSLGNRGNATSGKQEMAQQRQGDMANFHYADNLNRTVRHAGRCILSMIPNYYDTQRVVRILGEDGTASHAKINTPIPQNEQKPDENGAVKTVLNDLTVPKYDVTVKAGPGFDTLRQENAEFFANAMASAKDPGTAAVVTYLAMKNQDAPGAEEATEMLETLLPPQAAAVLHKGDGEQMIQTPKGPLPISQAPHAIAMMDQQMDQMHEALQKADVDGQQIKQAELQLKGRELDIKGMEAQTAQAQAQADLTRAQAEAQASANDQSGMSQQALEAAKLDFERWKVELQETNKFAIAEMTTNKSLAQAAMTANKANPDGDTEFADDGTEQPSSGFQMLADTMNSRLDELAQAQQQSHEHTHARIQAFSDELARPKTLDRDPVTGQVTGIGGRTVQRDGNGRVIGLQ